MDMNRVSLTEFLHKDHFTNLNIFRHNLLQQRFGFALFVYVDAPILPVLRDVNLPVAKTAENLFDARTRTFCLKIWVRDLLRK